MASRILHADLSTRSAISKPLLVSLMALTVLLLLAATNCVREEDITLEQRAHQLSKELMCPVCDGQTIDGSNAQIARDMRAKVQELLQAGRTNAKIKEYFVLRYGEEILASPEGEGFNLLAWLVPVFIVVIGVAIAVLTIKNLQRSNARHAADEVAAASPSGANLADYLAQVDRDLGITVEPSTPDEEPKKPESSPEVDS